jgi:hypothetical protein
MTRTLCLTIILISLAITSTARADLYVYFGGPDNSKADLNLPGSTVTPIRNSFLADLRSYNVNDLESVPPGANPTLSFGEITGTTGFPIGVQSSALFSVSGTNFLVDAGNSAAPFADYIEFSQPISAFGMYMTQAGDGALNELTVTISNSSTGISQSFVQSLGPSWPLFNVTFLGVRDTDMFDRISFAESNDTDGILPDDLIVGMSVVPEPNSFGLTLVCCAGCAVLSRRRQRRAA